MLVDSSQQKGAHLFAFKDKSTQDWKIHIISIEVHTPIALGDHHIWLIPSEEQYFLHTRTKKKKKLVSKWQHDLYG